MGFRLVTAVLFLAVSGFAQPSPGIAARQWREAHERSILDEFFDLLRIPNTGQDAAAMRRNAEAIVRILERRGVAARLLEIEGAPPVVYGELLQPAAQETLIFYAHYDGQPVNPSKWYTGDPFRPTLMSSALETGGRPIPLPLPGWPTDPEWRIYARSAGDDKAAILALATALEALQRRNVPIHASIKFFFEGEEELGSPHLAQFLRRYKDLLRGDVWFFIDGPVHQTRQQQIIFGVRGIASVELTVYGPRRELHSGHYGNWAPNPAMLLARLLASFENEDGTVAIEGFYDDVVPLSEVEEQAIAEAPDYSAVLRRELWLAETVGGDRRLEEVINMPAINVRGLSSGDTGEKARNVIPSSATASLDIRLVKGMDYARTVQLLADHIRAQGFFVTETEPGEAVRLEHPRVCKMRFLGGYNATRTPMDSDLAQRVIAAIEQARGPVIKLPTMGGSLPLYAFEELLGASTIVVPIANHDDNQHAANENLRLQNLWDGIETMAALIALEPPAEEPTEEGASSGVE